MTQGADGGPGLSGLVVQTSTSLGLLFPSVFDAISCGESRGRVRKGQRKGTERSGKRTNMGKHNRTGLKVQDPSGMTAAVVLFSVILGSSCCCLHVTFEFHLPSL